jgi:hypothetical protein
VSTTDRACPDGIDSLERAVVTVLTAGDATWSIDATRLTLQAGSDGLTFQGR